LTTLTAKQGSTLADLTNLNLDGKCSTKNLQALSACTNLTSLSISCVGLTSFEGISALPLKRLTAADNQISGAALALLPPTLEFLDLAGNRIKLEALPALKQIKSLKALDLSANPCAESASYRTQVFEMLNELEYLDGKDRRGNERDGDDDEEEGEEEFDEGEELEGAAGEGEEGEGEDEEEEGAAPEYAGLVGEDPLEDDEEEYVEEGDEGEDDDDVEEDEDEDEDEDDEGEAKGTGQKRKRDEEDDGEEEADEDDA